MRNLALALTMIAAGSLTTGCVSDSPGPESGNEVVLTDGSYTPENPTLPLGWPAPIWPADNPYSPAKAILGRRLFFEGDLSRDGTVSCAWCHSPPHGFADRHRSPTSVGIGGLSGTRNAPTVVNIGFATAFMHDGAAATLEEQALLPLMNPIEMDMTSAEIEARLVEDSLYVRLFRQAFGPGPITIDKVARALATYQRTLVSFRSPYDRWVAGDSNALSESAKRGAQVFLGEKGGCVRCHIPPLFTDGKFHNIGIDTSVADSGRLLVTKLPADLGKFKTPTLRNIKFTEPYMHDGNIASLEHVVMHYNSELVSHPLADPDLEPLGLNETEILDLVAFLESLTDETILNVPEP